MGGDTKMLPKPDKKKYIKIKEFVKNAKKVKESFEEEANYIRERRIKYGPITASETYPLA
jgi:hypothetical protein